MGNSGSSGNSRSRNSNRPHVDNPPPTPEMAPARQPNQEIAANRYVFASATPYPPQYPNPNPPQYYQYAGYYPSPAPAMQVPLPAPFDHHHHRGDHPGWAAAAAQVGQRGVPALPPTPYVDHQKAVTIRNDVNLKKGTLKVEPDEKNPGKFLVTFSFDATVAGSITVVFFAKEEVECNLFSTKEILPKPVTVHFKEGLGQRYRQAIGEGIDFSMFEEEELVNVGFDVYPLAVKAEALPSEQMTTESQKNQKELTPNSQITQAVFEKKDNGDYQVHVVKQILWVNGTRYELHEIYGIGNAVEGDFDGNDSGKECVICLSEPRDTTILPCRHMCLCSECAKMLRYQTNRCPICRQTVERLLEIKVNRAVGEKEDEA